MDGIYSGILRPRKGSRPIDVSHISQERMQKRQIEEAKAAEERKRNQDTMKDVLKSLYVEPQFKNSRLNRVAREKAAEAVSNIVSLHATGDPSSWVGAMNELAKYNQVMSELRPIDDNWVNAAKVTGDAVKSGKGSFLYSPTTIEETGKTYSNLIELYNDPINDRNDKATQEGIETYGIAPFVSQVETSAGTFPVFQVPEAAIYADYAPEVMKAVTGAADELYSERIGKPYTETLGRASTSYQEMGLPTPVKEGLAAQTFSNREHVQFAVKAAADDYVASHPEMTRAQAMSEHMSRISSDPNYLKEVIKTYGIDRGVMPIVNQAKKRVQLESYTTPSSGGSPATGSIFGSDKVDVFKGEDVIKAQAAQPWETGQVGAQSYQYLAVAPIQLKKSVLMNTDIKAGTLYWDQKAKEGKGELRAPKGFESSQKVIPHELVVMSDGQKEKPYIRFLLAGERQESDDPIAAIQKGGLMGGGGGDDRFTSKSFESFYVPATDDNLKRLAAATETGIDSWKSLVSELEKTASQGRRSASAGSSGTTVTQGGGSPASGVIGQTAKKASAGAKPEKIDVTKLTGMDRVRAINQNRANGYE